MLMECGALESLTQHILQMLPTSLMPQHVIINDHIIYELSWLMIVFVHKIITVWEKIRETKDKDRWQANNEVMYMYMYVQLIKIIHYKYTTFAKGGQLEIIISTEFHYITVNFAMTCTFVGHS